MCEECGEMRPSSRPHHFGLNILGVEGVKPPQKNKRAGAEAPAHLLPIFGNFEVCGSPEKTPDPTHAQERKEKFNDYRNLR